MAQRKNTKKISQTFDLVIVNINPAYKKGMCLYISPDAYEQYLKEINRESAKRYKGFELIVCAIDSNKIMLSHADKP